MTKRKSKRLAVGVQIDLVTVDNLPAGVVVDYDPSSYGYLLLQPFKNKDFGRAALDLSDWCVKHIGAGEFVTNLGSFAEWRKKK